MGLLVPDRLFWAQPDADEDPDDNLPAPPDLGFDFPNHDTKH